MARYRAEEIPENAAVINDTWIRTYTGARVHIMKPEPSEIRIKDIAHALAHQCRFGGHTHEFYSVAQHSIMVADLLVDMGWPDLAICGLMHDAAETYLHDINRPLKRYLPEYVDIEHRFMAAICMKFGLPMQMHPVVNRADNIALSTEWRDLYAEPLDNCVAWSGEMPSARKIKPICPESAERAFMRRFRSMGTRRAA